MTIREIVLPLLIGGTIATVIICNPHLSGAITLGILIVVVLVNSLVKK